ncbi:unnamed protein product, partial [Echinostoma caproni]|uniref:C3H1-type domain-containing protein n=1 Tax=Echinostoma caproni TaxID=27848 RepID=A0A183B2U5_9TREM
QSSCAVLEEETHCTNETAIPEPNAVAHKVPSGIRILAVIDSDVPLSNGGPADLPPWHHPPLPAHLPSQPETRGSIEPIKEMCSFFRKTGACRFGASCSRRHDYPARNDPTSSDDMDELDPEQQQQRHQSRLVLRIADMFEHSQLGSETSAHRDPDDPDAALDVDEAQLLADFAEFYQDVHEELEARWGRIVTLRTCRNQTAHLRGSVYVEFARGPGAAWDAAEACQGRWFAGRQLSCSVVRLGGGWREAVCGK